MTTEQAQKRLEEIRRLLMQKDKAAKIIQDIDAQIATLAGGIAKTCAPQSQQISKNDFIAISGGAQ